VISKLSIGHLKAISSATIPLGPITVLVGPNDSGKSTVLQALMALSRCGDPARLKPDQVLESPPSIVATHGGTGPRGKTHYIKLSADGLTPPGSSKDKEHRYQYAASFSAQGNTFARESIEWDGQSVLSATFKGPIVIQAAPDSAERAEGWAGSSTELSVLASEPSSNRSAQLKPIFEAIAADLRATFVRLDARAIARPSLLGDPLLPDGSGLVGIVDELLTSGIGDEQIGQANDVIRKLSPHVKGVAAKLTSGGRKELHFALRNGAVIPASQMSDGIVLAAALVLIALRSGNKRLLIEEPENGLHPRQLKVVADTIRSIADVQGTQIVLTTHSPLLLNHFTAEEVVLVTRDLDGVHAQRMTEARGLDDLASEMALGELWYNVGDGNLARPA
jgi:ABC-type branched-subunit amino acid transport system ATPase component